ncbi:DUF397 domain-containing protein [Actinomadura sp. KC06]|uniref:DUF397 domain-containing protein n=1 Tax=Actinomadura sp. KC06 TaxID=2530369 RepID=UPI001A9DADD4|nr:DUF397 domain-containing protein [Actinomadura sp. KC06]
MASVAWRRSSHSGSDGNCVEVAELNLSLGVRDSKAPDAGHFTFGPQVWGAFVAEAKAGRYDRSAT